MRSHGVTQEGQGVPHEGSRGSLQVLENGDIVVENTWERFGMIHEETSDSP